MQVEALKRGERVKIVIIADHAAAEGGAPQVAIASALGLAAAGHDVVYVAGVGQDADPALTCNRNITLVRFGGLDVWSKSGVAAARDGIWNRAFCAALLQRLGGFDRSDTIVHVHQWTKYFSPSLFAVIRRSGLPLVVSMHDYFLVCPTGLMFRFDLCEPCALTPLSARCLRAPCDPRSSLHKGVRVLRALALRRALRDLPFAVVHVSEVGRSTIGRFLPDDALQVVIENPVACEDAGPRSARDDMKIAYCGRLTREKGVELVAQAARRLGVSSLFVGEGPLRERILEIDPRAEITGWMEKSAALDKLAREAACIVAPSLWPETGPLVVAEAMARGVPAIVSARAGAASRIVDGRNGFVVEPEVEAITQAISQLRAPGAAVRLGQAAYASFWADPPSLATHARKLTDLYDRLLSDGHAH